MRYVPFESNESRQVHRNGLRPESSHFWTIADKDESYVFIGEDKTLHGPQDQVDALPRGEGPL